jgi:hypothetical protein
VESANQVYGKVIFTTRIAFVGAARMKVGCFMVWS